MDYCYIEFNIKDSYSLERLKNIVEVIKLDKDNEIEDFDNKWISLFTEEELDEFRWPTQEEYDQTKKVLGDVFIKIVPCNVDKHNDWDIYSMFDAIMNAEYEIIGVRMLDDKIGRLEFNPFSYPHGGTECLEKLVSCTGNEVIASDGGTGRICM